MNEKLQKFLLSPILGTTLSKIILYISIAVLALAIFFVGEEIGFKRAQFSYHFSENYSKIFGERAGMMPFDTGLPNVHGATGKIISISLPSFVITNDSGVEKVITISNDSLIRELQNTGTSSDLKIGQVVTVLGSPNENGWISAKLIRILTTASSTSQTLITN
jgi:hypothetical protein